MTLLNKELVQVAIAAANGEVAGNFSAKDMSDVIRQNMIDELGTDKLDFRTFRKNRVEFFEFVEATISPVINDRSAQLFEGFVEYKNIKFGQENKFIIEDLETFPVATIAIGDGNVLRHRLESDELTIPMETIGLGVYEEFARFLAGRTDWPKLIDRLTESFAKDLHKRIADALYGSVDKLGDVYKKSGSFSDTSLKEAVLSVADHVEAANGQAVILGTKAALRKLKPELYSNEQAGNRNLNGVFGHIDGYETIVLPQFHKAGTDNFGVKDDVIFVVPSTNEKIVKVVQEGDYLVREENGKETYRQDMQVGFDVITRVGVAVLTGAKYGAVEISG